MSQASAVRDTLEPHVGEANFSYKSSGARVYERYYDAVGYYRTARVESADGSDE